MTDENEFLRLEHRGAIAILTIDHPPVNVLSAAVLEQFLIRIREIESIPSARVVVLASAFEKAFAAGADIREMSPMGPAKALVHGARGQAVTVALERLSLPVIAAVNGVCLGGGCEVALACDLIIASEDARFGQPEINLGVMPGWGGTQRLPRRIGAARAREWILTGRTATAAEAAALGLVLKVVPKAELLDTAIALANELAGKSSTALAAAKRALQLGVDRDLEGGLSEELELWKGLFGTPDQRIGMAAFVSKGSWAPEPRRVPEPDPGGGGSPEARARTRGAGAASGKAKN